MLVSRQEQSLTDEELEMDDVDKLVLERANTAFKESSVDLLDQVGHNLPYEKVSGKIDTLPPSSDAQPMHPSAVQPHYQQTLASLIDKTQELVHRHVEGDVWIVSAMAQRASAQSKIDSSIA